MSAPAGDLVPERSVAAGGEDAEAGSGAAGGRGGWPAVRRFLRVPFTKRTWVEHAYLVAVTPLVFGSFVAMAVLLWVGIATSAFALGIVVVALTVVAAREAAGAHRWLAAALLGERVPAPRRRRPRSRRPWHLFTAALADVSGWRAMAYYLCAFLVVVAGAWAMVVAWAATFVMAGYPILWQLTGVTEVDSSGRVRHSFMQFGDIYLDTWPRALAVSAAGMMLVFVAPWIARGVTALDRRLMRALLGPTRLSERVVDLETSRAQAVDASAATLRRIERDLHDGTQARLVALAMQLDMVKEKLGGAGGAAGTVDADLVRARDLLETAHHNATEAIVELRDVTRSIHPPALDRGLDPALATLAARSGVPATLRTDILTRPSPAIETIAYFCVAELLTNAAKHAGASRVAIDVTGGPSAVRLRVTDDGVGGAALTPGGGLAGLADRVRTVDGTLDVTSPEGGPTVVTVELPSGA